MKTHTCKHNGTIWVGQDVCPACQEYYSIMKRAEAAQSCPYGHFCHRYEHIHSQWSSDPPMRYQVRGEDNDGERVYTETLHTSNSKEECEAYIASFQGLTTEEQQDYNLPRNPTLVLEDNYQCTVCDMYENRKARVAKGEMPPFFIVVWSISRHYGGPEEGGWWYNWTTVEEVRKAYSLAQGLRHVRELKEKYPQPRFNIYSAANRGEGEPHIGLFYGENDPRWPQETTHRPRYE